MKKLSKLNLEKLAEEMQEIDAKDTVSSIGGDFYYTENGGFLGHVGGGNAVRVITENNYNAYRWSETMLNAAWQGGATSLSQSDISAQYKVLAGMAGYSVGLCSREASTVGQCQTVTSGSVTTSQVSINVNSNSYTVSNYYDIMVTLYHEGMHIDQGTLLHDNIDEAERQAYTAMFLHPDFTNCSAEFQRVTKSKALDYGVDYDAVMRGYY